jgi:hypothetical protein
MSKSPYPLPAAAWAQMTPKQRKEFRSKNANLGRPKGGSFGFGIVGFILGMLIRK